MCMSGKIAGGEEEYAFHRNDCWWLVVARRGYSSACHSHEVHATAGTDPRNRVADSIRGPPHALTDILKRAYLEILLIFFMRLNM